LFSLLSSVSFYSLLCCILVGPFLFAPFHLSDWSVQLLM
jgi:hypothetical protein